MPVQRSLLLLFSSLVLVRCIFEDQIGLFDWNQKFIGDVDFVDFGRSIHLGSQRNVIASVSTNSGAIIWRQVLEDNGKLSALLRCGHSILSVSIKGGVFLRSWDSNSGSILWEKTFDSASSRSALWCDPHANSVFFLIDSGFFVLNLKNGKTLWSFEKQVWSTNVQRLHLVQVHPTSTDTPKTLVAYGTDTVSSDVTVFMVQLSDVPQNTTIAGKRVFSVDRDSNCLPLSSSVENSNSQTTSRSFLVCIHANPNGPGSIIKTASLTDSSAEWKQMHISQISNKIDRLTYSRFLVTSASGQGSVFELDSSGAVVQKYSLNQVMLTSLTSFNNRNYLFSVFHEPDQPFKNFLLSVYDVTTGQPVDGWSSLKWTIAKHHGRVVSVSASVFKDSLDSLSFRVLVKTEDQAIQVLRENGQPQWLRDEALADIVAVEMVDLPVSESQARMEEEFGHTHTRNVFEMFIKRFRTQAAQLIAFLNDGITGFPSLLSKFRQSLFSVQSNSKTSTTTVTKDEVTSETFHSVPARLNLGFTDGSSEPLGEYAGQQSARSRINLNEFLTRDTFNLHKMVVVATAVGKVFGLESNKGRVVWEHLVPSGTVLTNGRLSLFQQRNTAHFPLPPITTLLLRSKSTNMPILFSFNPITGVPLDAASEGLTHMSVDIKQAVFSPSPVGEETDYIRPILLLDTDSQVHVYPYQYHSSLSSDAWPLYLFIVEHDSAHVAGYRVFGSSSNESQPIGSSASPAVVYKATQVWQMVLRSSGDVNTTGGAYRIVAAASRPATEHIYSVGRILGDRGVMYKYLNPNLIAVLTTAGDAISQTNIVMLYLIDVVSGRIVHSTTHRRCSEPINLIHSENWILYSYYNHKSLRHEVTVLELFEPTSEGEPCAAYSVPGPAQLFLRNILPTNWISAIFAPPPNPDVASSSQRNQASGYKPLSALGSRSIFSSLFRTTELDGACSSPASSSLVPRVLQQSYILSTSPIDGVASVTLTERGITSKSVIFGLQKGALIELPKSFFDPRRAIDLTPDLVEEGVLPYTPVLLMPDQAVISFNQSIMGMRAVRTAMTGLESTSLVFAYGLDLFFTRVAPSMTYDLLKEDFDYTAIATVTGGMIVASVVTQRLAARRAMFRAWA